MVYFTTVVAKILSYVPAIVGLVSIGLFILLNNSRDIRNKLFAGFNLLGATWLLFLGIADMTQNYTVALYSLKIALFFGQIMLLALYWFAIYFPYKSKINTTRQIIYSIPVVIIAFLLVTSLGVSTVSIQSFGVQPEKIGFLYTISDLIAIFYVVAGLAVLLSKYKHSNTDQKAQIRFVSYGLVIALVVNVFTGIILTLVKVDSQYVSLGGFSIFLFSVFVAYAMVKHKLFDIRFIVVRSLGYLLSLGLILFVTAFTIFGASNWLIEQGVNQQVRLWVYVALTLFFSVSYHPIKNAFDSMTRRLFYRDAYDTQELLNEFNQVIVSTIDLNQLLTRAMQTIDSYLKPETILFAVRDSESDTVRVVSNASDSSALKEALEQIRGYVHKSPEKLFVTYTLDEQHADLKQLLQKTNTGVLARITTDINVEGIGYIALGYKKSGNMYNPQDISSIEILANELAIAIQNALQFEEIQKFNITLQDKIDDATRKLKRTNDKLKQMDETKDEFISMASHQLRTPLTSVKGYLSMVLEGDAGEINEMQNKLLDQAFISSQRMVYLIADLLNVSRLRTGKFVIEPISSNLADVVEGEVHQLIDTAEARGLKLTYQKPDDFPSVMIDETKVRQVIMNFMDNAIYYSTDGGHINVELKDKGDTIEYTVTDDGIGVPKAEQHHLFTKFYRAGNAKKARPDGTGLGLFMAKKVVVAQGGNIIFKSDPGKGSVFGFSFQKSKLQALADSINAASDTTPSHPVPTKALPETPAGNEASNSEPEATEATK